MTLKLLPIRDAPHGGNGTNRTIQGQAGDSSAPKRARRHTRMNGFRKLKRGEKAPIPLNEFGAPIGDLGGSYCNFLCTIARHSTYCPLVYEQWPDVPIHMKNKIWDGEVLPRCEFIPDLDDYSQLRCGLLVILVKSGTTEREVYASTNIALWYVSGNQKRERIVFRMLLEKKKKNLNKMIKMEMKRVILKQGLIQQDLG
ncbi:hypothetical protein ACFE04_021233 [Oxalis oulophora]